MPRSGDVVLTDPTAIRAMAHPARIAVVEQLYLDQATHTATELAASTGLTPSAMSYHLRALERRGIVERAETAVDARERPWRAAGRRVRIQSGAGGRAASDALLGQLVDTLASQLSRWSARRMTQPEPWRHAGGVSRDFAHLTAAEAVRLDEELNAVVARYRTRRRRGRDRRRVDITFAVVPEPED